MDAHKQLATFLDRFTPEMAALGRTLIDYFCSRLPNADALIFDNYNFMGVGFSANGKSSGVFISVVLYPRWANLFFFKGALMDDPADELTGDGAIIRHVRIDSIRDFEPTKLETLIGQAVALSEPPVDTTRVGELRVHTVAARQRPRRPPG